jgi:glycosyltransferase involved in cell wall biosynthesis
LWPATPIALKKIKKNGLIALILRKLEKKLYKNATRVVATSPSYIQHIESITKKRNVTLVLNGIDDTFENKVINVIQKRNKIKIIYAGNIGVAQNLLTLVKAAKHLDESKYHIDIIGAGTQKKIIEEYINKNLVRNVTLISPIPRDQLTDVYNDADVLFLQLHSNSYFDKVIPSKIFEYLIFNKPIVYGLNGAAHEILNKYEGTYRFSPDDEIELVKVIESIEPKTMDRDCESLFRRKQSEKYADVIEGKISND